MTLNKKLFDSYSFLSICNYCKFLSRLYYRNSIMKLNKIYRLFIEDKDYTEKIKSYLSQSIELAKYVFSYLSVQPNNIALTGRGTVQLEYDYLNSYLELEIYPETIKCLFLQNRNDYDSYNKIELNCFEIYKLLNILENFFYRKDKIT